MDGFVHIIKVVEKTLYGFELLLIDDLNVDIFKVFLIFCIVLRLSR